MRTNGRLALAQQIKSRAQKEATKGASTRRGYVSNLTPLTVKVFNYSIPLVYDDDFSMSQDMLIYQKKIGFLVEDVVMMHHDDEWVLVSVITDTDISPAVPPPELQPGDLLPSAATTRTGALLCDGKPYLRADYPKLFAAISTAYGSTDGKHFNVPDLRGRYPGGTGTGTATGASNFPLGNQPTSGVAGEEFHVQTIAEMAAHHHPVGYDNSGGYVGTNGINGFQVNTGAGGLLGNGVASDRTAGYQDDAIIGTEGSSTGMSTLPPTSVVNFFIVTG